jgi:hypothetical protein
MPPVLTDHFETQHPAWHALADFAVSLVVVLAIALITSFLGATS